MCLCRPMILSENKKAYLSIVRKKADGIKIPSKEEKKYLPDYILWTAVGMAYWHLQNDMLRIKNNKQTIRVRELLDRYKETKKITFHLGNF